MKLHPEYSEKWVQGLIANDPAILGLGELVLKDKERIQPRAGRLDLLLQELETGRRYELELQLGATDEAHIIRTIEYWDIERRRYPQYDHCAVLVAEDITSRFLNVISLLNGQVPLIALQMSALQVGGSVTLVGNLSSYVDFPLQIGGTRELSFYGTYASQGDYPACLSMLARKAVDVERFISACAPDIWRW